MAKRSPPRQKPRLEAAERRRLVFETATSAGTTNAAYVCRLIQAKMPGHALKESTVASDLRGMREANHEWLENEMADTWLAWIRQRWPEAVKRIRDLDRLREKMVEYAGREAPPELPEELRGMFRAVSYASIAGPLSQVTSTISKEEKELADTMEKHPLYAVTQKYAQWYSENVKEAGR